MISSCKGLKAASLGPINLKDKSFEELWPISNLTFETSLTKIRRNFKLKSANPIVPAEKKSYYSLQNDLFFVTLPRPFELKRNYDE